MRCENVKVRLELPMPVNRPDCNGNIYTEEAIINAESTYKGAAIIDKTGDEDIVIGVVTNAKYSKKDSTVNVDGILRFGGTDCSVLKTHKNEDGVLVIDEFIINAVGITK